MDGKSQGFQIRNLVHVDCNIISFIAVELEPNRSCWEQGPILGNGPRMESKLTQFQFETNLEIDITAEPRIK